MTANIDDVVALVAKQIGGRVADGDLDVSLRQSGIDSLDLFDIILMLEERFDLEIDALLIDQDMSVAEFCRLAVTKRP